MTRHSAEKAKSNGVRADFLENNLAMLAPSNGHGSHIFWSLPRCKKFVVSREPVLTLKIKSIGSLLAGGYMWLMAHFSWLVPIYL